MESMLIPRPQRWHGLRVWDERCRRTSRSRSG
jgi:hypothetical protein